MSRATELLEQATPLPWWRNETEVDHGHATDVVWGPDGDAIATVKGNMALGPFDGAVNAALIVHAVNSLPAYEAAVEALERLLIESEQRDSESVMRPSGQTLHHARAALARLREGEPSNVR